MVVLSIFDTSPCAVYRGCNTMDYFWQGAVEKMLSSSATAWFWGLGKIFQNSHYSQIRLRTLTTCNGSTRALTPIVVNRSVINDDLFYYHNSYILQRCMIMVRNILINIDLASVIINLKGECNIIWILRLWCSGEKHEKNSDLYI